MSAGSDHGSDTRPRRVKTSTLELAPDPRTWTSAPANNKPKEGAKAAAKKTPPAPPVRFRTTALRNQYQRYSVAELPGHHHHQHHHPQHPHHQHHYHHQHHQHHQHQQQQHYPGPYPGDCCVPHCDSGHCIDWLQWPNICCLLTLDNTVHLVSSSIAPLLIVPCARSVPGVPRVSPLGGSVPAAALLPALHAVLHPPPPPEVQHRILPRPPNR